jgi:hypothetical protein
MTNNQQKIENAETTQDRDERRLSVSVQPDPCEVYEFDLADIRRFLHVEVLGKEDARFFITVIPGVAIPKDDQKLPWYARLVGPLWEMKYEGYGLAFSASTDATNPGHYRATSRVMQGVPLSMFDNLPMALHSQSDQAPVDWEKEKPKVQDALRSIPASIDWHTWHDDVLKPLCNASGGSEDCYAMLDEWACTCERYATGKARSENRRQWEILKKRERQSDLDKKRRLGSFYRLAYQYGWQGWIEPVTVEIATPSEVAAGGLADKTNAAVRQTFQAFEQKHDPSPAQWLALSDLAAHLEGMANGTAKPLYYLSSLDPGVGKTQTITHFVKTLQGSPDHEDIGVINRPHCTGWKESDNRTLRKYPPGRSKADGDN